ncbi:MAG: LysE family transporter [Pelotomaculum sp.]|jgi:threonine/homoserine/homoserine lactone efflux protein
MELIGLATSAFVLGLSGAMMPGPLLTVTIGESAKRGFLAGPLIVLGHALLELALILALVAGLSVFLTRASVTQAIAVVGGIFLVYMGWTMARDARSGKVSLPLNQGVSREPSPGTDQGPAAATSGSPLRRGGFRPIAAGILVSLANPYWTLWWATIGLSFITLSLQSGYTGLAIFFSGHILADLVWYSLVAGVIAGGRRFINDQAYRGILVVCGIFLVGLGIYFMYSGLTARVTM